MTCRVTEINVDCTDPAGLAGFWCAALGYSVLEATDGLVEVGPERGSDAELLEAVRREPVAPSMFFALVPEGKTVKNRLHLDLSPIDCTQTEEVARLELLGARRADVGQTGAESWVVMADPEGNEFCVLRSLAPGEFDL